MPKKKVPLNNSQAVFVCKGMLSTLDRINKECILADDHAMAKAKSGIHGLIISLSGGLNNVS